jgi:hypothetical protein
MTTITVTDRQCGTVVARSPSRFKRGLLARPPCPIRVGAVRREAFEHWGKRSNEKPGGSFELELPAGSSGGDYVVLA